jgi:hypothetical protein
VASGADAPIVPAAGADATDDAGSGTGALDAGAVPAVETGFPGKPPDAVDAVDPLETVAEPDIAGDGGPSAATPDDLQSDAADSLQEAADTDYSAIIDRLRSCETIQELFEKIREETNGILRTDPRFREILSRFEGQSENIMEAVYKNDFSTLQIDKKSEEYTLVLRLTAIKNAIIAELTKLALAEYGDRLGVDQAEKTTILGFQEMIPHVDEIYIKWRQQLFPPELLENSEFQKNAADYLEKHNLDDPYAVVIRTPDGDYECLPYAYAFPGDYEGLVSAVEKLITDISAIPTAGFGKNTDRKSLLEYLKTYKAALSCAESEKPGREWQSVKLWKAVYRAWLKCRDRVQFIHGIENGYDPTVDPSEIRVVPELKLAIQYTTPKIDSLIRTMKAENAVALIEMIRTEFGNRADDLVANLNIIARSHVGMIEVIGGGGNSMDFLGAAQVGPNDPDVSKKGVKAYVSAKDTFDGEPLRDSVAREVFGDESANRNLAFLVDDTARDQYLAQFIAGHELGHLFADEIKGFEETKATWAAMLATYEREEKKLLPAGTSEAMMKGHIKYCLRYLADTVEFSDEASASIAQPKLKADKDRDVNDKEGIINVRLFLETRLITRGRNGKYVFHPEKIQATYAKMKVLFLKFVELYLDGDENELNRWVEKLSAMTRTEPTQLVEVRNFAVKGKQRHNAKSKSRDKGPPDTPPGSSPG